MLIRNLVFFIHPFCYGHHAARGMTAKQWPYGPFEDARVASWWRATAELPDDAALAMVPLPGTPSEQTRAYCEHAAATLGKRFILMDCPDYQSPAFWKRGGKGAPTSESVLAEFRDLCLGQGSAWSKEEVETGLHTRACVATLEHELTRRGLRLDRNRLKAQGWGASFEGCVTKYTLNFARLLRLANPVQIDFAMTMCDAAFMLGATCVERVTVGDTASGSGAGGGSGATSGGAVLHLFRQKGRGVAIFFARAASPADRAARVRLRFDGAGLRVTDKRGVRLWPNPRFKPVCADVGLAEPPQELVRLRDGRLEAPLCTGLVYRMAKAPAYFHAPRGMSMETFRSLLVDAEIVAG